MPRCNKLPGLMIYCTIFMFLLLGCSPGSEEPNQALKDDIRETVDDKLTVAGSAGDPIKDTIHIETIHIIDHSDGQVQADIHLSVVDLGEVFGEFLENAAQKGILTEEMPRTEMDSTQMKSLEDMNEQIINLSDVQFEKKEEGVVVKNKETLTIEVPDFKSIVAEDVIRDVSEYFNTLGNIQGLNQLGQEERSALIDRLRDTLDYEVTYQEENSLVSLYINEPEYQDVFDALEEKIKGEYREKAHDDNFSEQLNALLETLLTEEEVSHKRLLYSGHIDAEDGVGKTYQIAHENRYSDEETPESLEDLTLNTPKLKQYYRNIVAHDEDLPDGEQSLKIDGLDESVRLDIQDEHIFMLGDNDEQKILYFIDQESLEILDEHRVDQDGDYWRLQSLDVYDGYVSINYRKGRGSDGVNKQAVLSIDDEGLEEVLLLENVVFDGADIVSYREADYALVELEDEGAQIIDLQEQSTVYETEAHELKLSDQDTSMELETKLEATNDHRYVYVYHDYRRAISSAAYGPRDALSYEEDNGKRFQPEDTFIEVVDLEQQEVVRSSTDFTDKSLSTYDTMPVGQDNMIVMTDNKGWLIFETRAGEVHPQEIGGPYRHSEESEVYLELFNEGTFLSEDLLLTQSGEVIEACYSVTYYDLWFLKDESLKLLGHMPGRYAGALTYDSTANRIMTGRVEEDQEEVKTYKIDDSQLPKDTTEEDVPVIDALDQLDFMQKEVHYVLPTLSNHTENQMIFVEEGLTGFLIDYNLMDQDLGLLSNNRRSAAPVGLPNFTSYIQPPEAGERVAKSAMVAGHYKIKVCREQDRLYLINDEGIHQYKLDDFIRSLTEFLD